MRESESCFWTRDQMASPLTYAMLTAAGAGAREFWVQNGRGNFITHISCRIFPFLMLQTFFEKYIYFLHSFVSLLSVLWPLWHKMGSFRARHMIWKWAVKMARDVSRERCESPAQSGYHGGLPVLFTFLLRFTWFILAADIQPRGRKKGNEFDVMIVYWGNLNVTKC